MSDIRRVSVRLLVPAVPQNLLVLQETLFVKVDALFFEQRHFLLAVDSARGLLPLAHEAADVLYVD